MMSIYTGRGSIMIRIVYSQLKRKKLSYQYSLRQTSTLFTLGAKNWRTLILCNCFIPNQLTHTNLIYVHFTGPMKTYIFRKNIFLKLFWELAVYVQVYLFIILYSYWIATNIIQYLLYLVVLVYEYLSVFTQLYLKNGVSYCIKE